MSVANAVLGWTRPGIMPPLPAMESVCVKRRLKVFYSMDDSGLASLIVLATIAFAWLLPLIIIFRSEKTTGGEKTAWILLVLFVSWFAWVFYVLLAPLKKRTHKKH